MGTIDDTEQNYYANVLNSDHHYKHQRREATISKFVEYKDKTKRDNAMIKVGGIHFTPLLEGKVQLDLVYNTQRELLLEELFLREIIVNQKEQITKLKEYLMRNEYPDDGEG